MCTHTCVHMCMCADTGMHTFMHVFVCVSGVAGIPVSRTSRLGLAEIQPGASGV